MRTVFQILILTIFTLFISCAHEKGGITDEMKIGLISFEQKTVDYPGTEINAAGKITENRSDGILTLTYLTEETGCPHFEGGYKIIDKSLTIYYQDVNFQPVKCINLFELTYKIKDENLDYKKIKAVQLKPIKKRLGFNE